MTKTLFAWDEIDTGLTAREPDKLLKLNREGGWEYQGMHPNGVAILSTGRHQALECWATSDAEAHRMMMEASEIYREINDDLYGADQ